MSIINTGDWPLDPNVDDGVSLSEKLNRLSAAALSSFASPTRSPGIVDGMCWTRQETNGDRTLVMFTNGVDREILSIASGTNALSFRGSYNTAQIDQFIQQLQNQINAVVAVPVGGIIMWGKAANLIPSNFQICDGTNGTPALVDKFPVGAGGAIAAGAQGGKNQMTLTEAQLPSHTHQIPQLSGTTDPDGDHTHTYQDSHTTRTSSGIESGGEYRQVVTPRTTDPSGDHTHAFTTDPNITAGTGGGQPFDNRPEYVGVLYIMRMT